MPLYLLTRIGRVRRKAPLEYVIRASTVAEARQLAAWGGRIPVQGEEIFSWREWLDPDLSSCEKLQPDGKPAMITTVFNGE